VSDFYSSKALNADLRVPGSNAAGCRIFGTSSQPKVSGPAEEKKLRTADFLRTFTLRRENTQFAPEQDVVYIESQHVAYVHFNGHCKPHMCQTWMCENISRWAKKQTKMPDLSALKYCCDFEPTKEAM
jgi:hypothetical protein